MTESKQKTSKPPKAIGKPTSAYRTSSRSLLSLSLLASCTLSCTTKPSGADSESRASISSADGRQEHETDEDHQVRNDAEIRFQTLPTNGGQPGGGVYACPVNLEHKTYGEPIDVTGPSTRVTDVIDRQFRGKTVRLAAYPYCPQMKNSDLCRASFSCPTSEWSVTLCRVGENGSVQQFEFKAFPVPKPGQPPVEVELFMCTAGNETSKAKCPRTKGAKAPDGGWCSDPVVIIKRDD